MYKVSQILDKLTLSNTSHTKPKATLWLLDHPDSTKFHPTSVGGITIWCKSCWYDIKFCLSNCLNIQLHCMVNDEYKVFAVTTLQGLIISGKSILFNLYFIKPLVFKVNNHEWRDFFFWRKLALHTLVKSVWEWNVQYWKIYLGKLCFTHLIKILK